MRPTAQHDVMVVGIGNYLKGDDGIGLRIVEHIVDNALDATFAARTVASCNIELLTWFTPQLRRMLLVDCAVMQLAPGECRLIERSELRKANRQQDLSTHQTDLLTLLDMATQLDLPQPAIRLLAVQPAQMRFGEGLSEPVRDRFDEYVARVITCTADDSWQEGTSP